MRAILFILLALLASPAVAETPAQFAAPGLRAPDDPIVNGIRFSVIVGRNESVRGVDFGLISMSETANLTGFSAILGVGKLNGNLEGMATGIVNLHSGRDRGVNAAFFNQIHTLESGANIGFVNVSDDFTMVDIGGLNVSDSSTVQVGFINVTQRIKGVQIGFLNVASNGFLPVFPFFNFPKN